MKNIKQTFIYVFDIRNLIFIISWNFPNKFSYYTTQHSLNACILFYILNVQSEKHFQWGVLWGDSKGIWFLLFFSTQNHWTNMFQFLILFREISNKVLKFCPSLDFSLPTVSFYLHLLFWNWCFTRITTSFIANLIWVWRIN